MFASFKDRFTHLFNLNVTYKLRGRELPKSFFSGLKNMK